MTVLRRLSLVCVLLSYATLTSAQTPPPAAPPPPPISDIQLGASFVGTSGNTDTSTLGADFSAVRRWPVWKIEAKAAAISTTDDGESTAERFLAAFRGDRKINDRLALSLGERAERDRLSGISFRSITDGGLKYAVVRRPNWTLDSLTSLALNHEDPVEGDSLNHAIAVLQALNRWIFSPTADTTQRITFYPDFQQSDAYRAEAEITAQASMNSRLALKFGYLWRYSNAPAFGFLKSDNTATASVVLRWTKPAPLPAPAP